MFQVAKIIAFFTRRFYPRGTQRILKLIFRPGKFKIKTVMNYDGNLKINIDTSSYVEWELFFQGYYEKWVIDLMKNVIGESDVVVDVGANIGTHTLIMGKLVEQSGKVLAFDPDPVSVLRLKENIEINQFKNIKVFEYALSRNHGQTSLYVHNSDLNDKGTSSLYELPKLDKEKIDVSVYTLDEIAIQEKLNKLNFIKIDTRGSDFPVIEGAIECIKKYRPYVIFEYNLENWNHSNSKWQDMRAFFDSKEYVLYLVLRGGLLLIEDKTEEKTSYNILAVPNEKLSNIQKLCLNKS